MNKLIKTLSVVFGVAVMTLSSVQAREIKIGTGGLTGNYYAVGNDINDYCGTELEGDSLNILESNGSTDNLLGMSNKKFTMGIVQEDVLTYHKKRSPNKVNDKRLKVVSPLHVEAVHLLIPKGYNPDGDSGWMGKLFGGDSPVKVSLDLLRNQQIGSWGGSMVSAQALSYFFDLNMDVVEVPKANRANPDMPLLLVGGYPYKPAQDYIDSGKYHLVSLDYDIITQRAGFYTKEVINYNIDGKVTSIPTIGVRALLIGKSFRKDERNHAARLLTTCIEDSLADLADDDMTSPLWSGIYEYVDDDGQVDWNYFELLDD